MMTVMMMTPQTYIIKGRLADGKFDCFSAVSHQLNHMVPGRPGDHHHDKEEEDDIVGDGVYGDGVDDDDIVDDGVDDDSHLATSSPLMERIWSPGISLSTLGPPPVTNLNGDIIELSFNLYLCQPWKSKYPDISLNKKLT